jgi:hypothetical protein
VQRHVERLDEARDAIERDTLAAAVTTGRARPYESRRGRIGIVPVSSSAVTTQIVFEPLIAWARSACRMMNPASASGSLDGNTTFALACERPRGSKQRKRRIRSSTSLTCWSFSRAVAPGMSKTLPR